MEKFERFLNRDKEPSNSEYEKEMGKRIFKTYQRMNDYLRLAYEIDPIQDSGGKKYGWNYKYRKAGKTICTLFPEKKAFTVLVTLGKNDLEKLKSDFKKLSPELQKLIKDTDHYHDGKWLWIRIPIAANIDDIKLLTSLKRKPKNHSEDNEKKQSSKYLNKLKKKLGFGWDIYLTNTYANNKKIKYYKKPCSQPIFCVHCGSKNLIEIYSEASGTVAGGGTDWVYECKQCGKYMTIEKEWG